LRRKHYVNLNRSTRERERLAIEYGINLARPINAEKGFTAGEIRIVPMQIVPNHAE